MWGTRLVSRPRGRGARFIPTHVGNTRCICRARPRGPVHPHACGEHNRKIYERASWDGSSPRMWGTLLTSRLAFFTPRFIPTHVGNTSQRPFLPMKRAVHPHACGEHMIRATLAGVQFGSSPRMWGTRPGWPPVPRRCRFIPTHVGNTRSLRSVIGLHRFIPTHVGNTFPSIAAMLCMRFIPTHVGNTPGEAGRHQGQGRFIPTHVGNTQRS